MADPDFNLMLDREYSPNEEKEYLGVGWLNKTIYGQSIKINVQKNIESKTRVKLTPRKGFDFKLTRTSSKNPDFYVKLGKTKEFVGSGWARKNNFGTFEISMMIDEFIPKNTILFSNPRQGSEDILEGGAGKEEGG